MNQRDLKFYTSQLYELFKDISEPGGGKGFRYWHGLRVMIYVKNFLKKYSNYFKKFKISSEVATITALFHDIGKIEAADASKFIDYNSYGNLKHEEIGSHIIKKILSKRLSGEKIDKIAEVIKEQNEPKKVTPESLLVSDCDILDNCGLLKLWRTITYAHYQERNVDRVWEYWEKEQGRKRIEKEVEEIHFPLIKKVALRRLEKLDLTIREMKKETEGNDF